MKILSKLTEIFNLHSKDSLKDVTTSIDKALETTYEDIKALDLEYSVQTASGEWLNEWGTWFGIPRKNNQSDSSYREDIFKYIFKQHSTANAYENKTKEILGEDTTVKIHETHNDVRMFNQSTFSGTGRYPDSEKYRLGVVIIYLDKPVTSALIEAIDKIRAAGIKVYYQFIGGGVVDMGDQGVFSHRKLSSHSLVESYSDHTFSGRRGTILSDSSEVISSYSPNRIAVTLRSYSTERSDGLYTRVSFEDQGFFTRYDLTYNDEGYLIMIEKKN